MSNIIVEPTWRTLERNVRQLSAYIWKAQAVPATIAGVNFDCVLKSRPDYWVLVEITEQDSLEKVREDITKLAAARMALFGQSIYAECHLVSSKIPTPSMRATGEASHVTVSSYNEYEGRFLNFDSYSLARQQRAFGSAVNPISGEPDTAEYTAVGYSDLADGHTVNIAEIARMLQKGRRIVLLGNFGTGKSRCVRETFLRLVDTRSTSLSYPLAINLKEHWGAKAGPEILRRHFADLGLTDLTDAALAVLDKGSLILSLDGFDELGAQVWSNDSGRLRMIRHACLAGVRSLISQHKGGLLISGREHYFSSQAEMFTCLGIEQAKTTILRCRDEFSQEEMAQYLQTTAKAIAMPTWLPRRPLICQLIAQLDNDELERIFIESGGEIEFWHLLLENICNREARINQALDAATIRSIYILIARYTRAKRGDTGPLLMGELEAAFTSVVGTPPVDESALILHRLPGLGRVESETNDRQFVDYYILDGLRAEDLVRIVGGRDYSICTETWVNRLRKFGLARVANAIRSEKSYSAFFQYLQRVRDCSNRVLQSDILASMAQACQEDHDLAGAVFHDLHITELDLGKPTLVNYTLSDSVIDELWISHIQPQRVRLSRCLIGAVHGVSSAEGLPAWLKETNTVEHYDTVDNVSQIRNARLSPGQRILVTVIRKTFFQPGSGRKEEALLRGLGEDSNKKLAHAILNRLCGERILEKGQGDDGWIYRPKRHHTRRMDEMLTQLTLSNDPLWHFASGLGKSD